MPLQVEQKGHKGQHRPPIIQARETSMALSPRFMIPAYRAGRAGGPVGPRGPAGSHGAVPLGETGPRAMPPVECAGDLRHIGAGRRVRPFYGERQAHRSARDAVSCDPKARSITSVPAASPTPSLPVIGQATTSIGP